MTAAVGRKSIHFRVLEALATYLRAQQLDGIDINADRIFIKKKPWTRQNLQTAGMYLCPVPERLRGRDSATDVVGWGVSITIVSAPIDNSLTDEAQINRQLLNREILYDCLLPLTDDVLPGCQDIVREIEIVPGELFINAGIESDCDIQQLIVIAWGNKIRGTEHAT